MEQQQEQEIDREEILKQLDIKALQLYEKGSIIKSLECNEKALMIRMEILGVQHGETYAFLNSFVKTFNQSSMHLLNSGNIQKSETVLKRLLKLLKEYYPEEYALRILSLNNLSCISKRENKLGQSKKLLSKAFLLEDNLEHKSEYFALSNLNMSAIYSQLNDHAPAKKCALQAIQILTEEVKQMKSELNEASKNYLNQDNKQETERLRSEMHEKISLLAISHYNLATQDEYLKNYQECITNFENAVALLRDHFEGEKNALIHEFMTAYKNAKRKYGSKIQSTPFQEERITFTGLPQSRVQSSANKLQQRPEYVQTMPPRRNIRPSSAKPMPQSHQKVKRERPSSNYSRRSNQSNKSQKGQQQQQNPYGTQASSTGDFEFIPRTNILDTSGNKTAYSSHSQGFYNQKKGKSRARPESAKTAKSVTSGNISVTKYGDYSKELDKIFGSSNSRKAAGGNPALASQTIGVSQSQQELDTIEEKGHVRFQGVSNEYSSNNTSQQHQRSGVMSNSFSKRVRPPKGPQSGSLSNVNSTKNTMRGNEIMNSYEHLSSKMKYQNKIMIDTEPVGNYSWTSVSGLHPPSKVRKQSGKRKRATSSLMSKAPKNVEGDHPLIYKNIYVADGGKQYWLQVKHINRKNYQFLLREKSTQEIEMRLVLLPEELHVSKFDVEEQYEKIVEKISEFTGNIQSDFSSLTHKPMEIIGDKGENKFGNPADTPQSELENPPLSSRDRKQASDIIKNQARSTEIPEDTTPAEFFGSQVQQEENYSFNDKDVGFLNLDRHNQMDELYQEHLRQQREAQLEAQHREMSLTDVNKQSEYHRHCCDDFVPHMNHIEQQLEDSQKSNPKKKFRTPIRNTAELLSKTYDVDLHSHLQQSFKKSGVNSSNKKKGTTTLSNIGRSQEFRLSHAVTTIQKNIKRYLTQARFQKYKQKREKDIVYKEVMKVVFPGKDPQEKYVQIKISKEVYDDVRFAVQVMDLLGKTRPETVFTNQEIHDYQDFVQSRIEIFRNGPQKFDLAILALDETSNSMGKVVRRYNRELTPQYIPLNPDAAVQRKRTKSPGQHKSRKRSQKPSNQTSGRKEDSFRITNQSKGIKDYIPTPPSNFNVRPTITAPATQTQTPQTKPVNNKKKKTGSAKKRQLSPKDPVVRIQRQFRNYRLNKIISQRVQRRKLNPDKILAEFSQTFYIHFIVRVQKFVRGYLVRKHLAQSPIPYWGSKVHQVKGRFPEATKDYLFTFHHQLHQGINYIRISVYGNGNFAQLITVSHSSQFSEKLKVNCEALISQIKIQKNGSLYMPAQLDSQLKQLVFQAHIGPKLATVIVKDQIISIKLPGCAEFKFPEPEFLTRFKFNRQSSLEEKQKFITQTLERESYLDGNEIKLSDYKASSIFDRQDSKSSLNSRASRTSSKAQSTRSAITNLFNEQYQLAYIGQVEIKVVKEVNVSQSQLLLDCLSQDDNTGLLNIKAAQIDMEFASSLVDSMAIDDTFCQQLIQLVIDNYSAQDDSNLVSNSRSSVPPSLTTFRNLLLSITSERHSTGITLLSREEVNSQLDQKARKSIKNHLLGKDNLIWRANDPSKPYVISFYYQGAQKIRVEAVHTESAKSSALSLDHNLIKQFQNLNYEIMCRDFIFPHVKTGGQVLELEIKKVISKMSKSLSSYPKEQDPEAPYRQQLSRSQREKMTAKIDENIEDRSKEIRGELEGQNLGEVRESENEDSPDNTRML